MPHLRFGAPRQQKVGSILDCVRVSGFDAHTHTLSDIIYVCLTYCTALPGGDGFCCCISLFVYLRVLEHQGIIIILRAERGEQRNEAAPHFLNCLHPDTSSPEVYCNVQHNDTRIPHPSRRLPHRLRSLRGRRPNV